MRTKRLVSLLLVAMLVAALFSGCGKKDAATDTTTTEVTTTETKETTDATADTTTETVDTGSGMGWKDHASEKVKLTWYLNFSWYPNQWGVDATSKYITEKTGVDIEFIVPAGNEAEKLNSMIASNTLPDIITLGWWEGQVNQMIDGDLVYSLNELADQYDMYFYDVADPAKLGWYAKDNGKTYGYPNASYTPNDYEKYDNISSNQTFLVRKDMYEAIGSPDMSTPEGFLKALNDAKAMFPQVNDQPIIPFGLHEFNTTGNMSIDTMLPNFLALPKEKDGQLYDNLTDPSMVSWLKTFRNAYSQGLISDDVFIDKRVQMEEKIAQGRYFSMLYQGQDALAPIKSLYAEDPTKQYIAVDGPKNLNGDAPTLGATGVAGWTLTLISKNCQNPDRAIQFFSYMMSDEGQHDIYLGAENGWATVDGKDQFKPEALELMNTDRAAYDKEYGGENTFWMFMDLAKQAQWTPAMTEPVKQFKEWTMPYVTWQGQYDDTNPQADTDLGAQGLRIGEKWGQVLPQLLMASSESEFDKVYNDFITFRNENGFDAINAYKMEKVQSNKAKLGIK